VSRAGKSWLTFSTVLTLVLTVAAVAGADDEGYELVKSPAPAVRAGKPAVFSLSLVPRAGHRLLADGPVLVRVGGENVAPQRALYRRDDAVDPRADVPRFELAITAANRGPAHLDAHCTFYLCKAARCRPVETNVSWLFDVSP
jgi:hypothetical protein